MLDDLFPNEESEAERELAPTVDVPDESDADPQLQRRFWLLVLVFNVALLAASVGAMLAAFRGQYDTGGSLLAAGAILAAYGSYKYRVYANADADGDAGVDGEADADGDGDGDREADADGDGDAGADCDSAAVGTADADEDDESDAA